MCGEGKARVILARAAAFVRRDFLFQWSYKFGFVYEVGSLFSTLVTLYFVGRMFGGEPPAAVAGYGTDYFTFALVGMVFVDYMWVSMRTFAQHVRMAQFMGTLEAMLVTPTRPFGVVLYSATYTYLWTLLRSVVYLLLGTSLFGARFADVDVVAAAVFSLLTVLAFAGIGIVSAAMTLYLKQSDPLTSVIGGVSFLFAGILYPVQSLPPVLQDVAWALPMTHAVEGLRQAVLQGRTVADLWPHAAVLGAWAAVAFPVAFLVLRRVLRGLSREGSFGAY
ncbi:MAG: ABC transporter permease [Deltaproteobacteria bacterium]|nr:ABC transporter permease [Deltaproteobacteria bacterium]